MGIQRSSESEYEREMARWNTPRNREVPGQPGVYGFGPVGIEKYPQMLYKAFRDDNGQIKCMEPPPPLHMYLSMPEYQRAEAIAKAFTDKCQTTVRSDGEYEKARSEGWRDTVALALEHAHALEREIADAAAEEQYRVRKMSPKAQAELAQANAETDAHVVEVPVPKKKPGRPAKALAHA